jgi:hypothetical protein
MTTAVIHEQTKTAEREIARTLVEAHETLGSITKTLPLFLDGSGDPEDAHYMDLVREAGEALAPTLASVSRLCEETEGIEDTLGLTFPPELPRFVHLLEDAFVLLWSVQTPRDLRDLPAKLPTAADERQVLDPKVVAWIREWQGDIER